MIAIVNYGLGNIRAFVDLYKRLNIPIKVAGQPDDLKGVEKIILPGVGAFDWAMTRLNASGMCPVLKDLAVAQRIPVLGICVGMQILADRSDEGKLPGLGWIRGEVKKFAFGPASPPLSLPHMGWNDVTPRRGDGLFRGLEHGARFYFLHSYHFVPKQSEDALSVTNYGGEYVSAVRSGNVYGVQFHPEKSHGWGIQLLKNFAEL